LAAEVPGTTQQPMAVNVNKNSDSLTPAWCTNPPRGQCSFYAECVESVYHCGADGYPLGYGQKYCDKFSDSIATLSSQGQKWMLDTMECLQLTLVNQSAEFKAIASSPLASTTCNVIKETAFDSHSKCYLDSGLCSLPWTDWLAIVNIIDVKTLFSSVDAVKETLQAADGCAGLSRFIKKLL
jgi:hypothetical protein